MKFNKNILLACALLVCSIGRGQVVINEYSAANWKQFSDNYDNTEDWIELFNGGATTVNLSGWHLSDKQTDPLKWTFPSGSSIAPNGFLIIWCSKRNEVKNGFYHANFSLTQTKGSDFVILSDAGGVIKDSKKVDKTLVHQSWARSTDGGAIWKICTDPSLAASNNNLAQFEGFTARPTFSLEAGFYTGAQKVGISCADPTAVIRYTLNGHEPTENSAIYTDSITISQTLILKAKAFSANAGVLPSFIQFNTYLINEDFSLVVMSVGADTVLELANDVDKELRPVGTIEYFGIDKIRKTRSYGELNSHGQDSWVNDQRSLDWVSRDEMGYSGSLNEKIFTYSDRSEYQRVILRASGDDNFPGNFLPQHKGCAHIRDEYTQTLAKLSGLKLDVRAAERIIVFLNGQYWGVYGLREYPDDSDYTEYYYGQDKFHVQMMETWGNTWTQYGGDAAYADWRKTRDLILQNNMGDPAKYAQAADSLNMTSLCDYFICGLNFVASDWINYNTAWWRGTDPAGNHKKWGYLLWDFDAVFDYYINYSGVPNTNADAAPCDIDAISDYCQNDFFGNDPDTCYFLDPPIDSTLVCEKIDGKHDVIFRKLLAESPEFQQLYYSRQADLGNTMFSCANMLHVLDSMVAVIDPEMSRHTQRWGGTKTKWLSNVAKMRTFIQNRCTLLDDGMVDCYQLTGPFPLTIDVKPAGSGEIDFNTLKFKSFPVTYNYFGQMAQKIQAKPNTGWFFKHWETKSGGAITPTINDAEAELTVANSDTLVAVFSLSVGTTQPSELAGLKVFPTLTSDGKCTVDFQMPTANLVKISLLNTLGEQVFEQPVVAGFEGKNTILVDFSAKNLASGVYFLKISAANQQSVSRISLVK